LIQLNADLSALPGKAPKGDVGHRIPCRFWQPKQRRGEGDTIMKKIAAIFALAFALTTGTAVVTVIAHMDQAMASSAGTVVTHPEQANICDETAC
jgi:hypothetical protein